MKTGVARSGYTIVEVMIFLAISGALLMAAMVMLSGQQAKTEFAQAARDFESRIRDIINDVSVGYYPNDGNIKCEAGPAGVILSTSSGELGTNAQCIFVGKVIQFAPKLNPGSVRIYTVAGLRQTALGPGSLREVNSLEEAVPKIIAREGGDPVSVPEVFDDVSLGPMKVGKVTYSTNVSSHETAGVGFFTTFKGNTSGGLRSGFASSSLGPIPIGAGAGPTTLDQDYSGFIERTNKKMRHHQFRDSLNPANGVTICLLSTGTNQRAILTIGGQAKTLSTDMFIEGGTTCP